MRQRETNRVMQVQVYLLAPLHGSTYLHTSSGQPQARPLHLEQPNITTELTCLNLPGGRLALSVA
jgi:hypothetical protein